MPRYLVNLGAATEVEAEDKDTALAIAKDRPLSKMRVFHSSVQTIPDPEDFTKEARQAEADATVNDEVDPQTV